MNAQQIGALADGQRGFFMGGKTRDIAFRTRALETLLQGVLQMEDELCEALFKDLGKGKNEAYLSEIGLVIGEIKYLLRNLSRFAKPKRAATPLVLFPGKSKIRPEPYGVCLIMSPWNYPVQLTLLPLAGALAAGNCALVKPSSYAPNVSRALSKLLSCFKEEYVCVVEGGRKENQALLKTKFDFIFFTGGSFVGRQVLHAAAEHLTPVTLELGGKSPCIVLKDADMDVTARRVLFGKILNAGQTCVAPDYLLVEKGAKEELLLAMQRQLKVLCPDPLRQDGYPCIVNRHHFDRLASMLRGSIVIGGEFDESALKIAPTVIDNVSPSHPSMQEEIFGPILPVLEIEDEREAIDLISQRPSPLALYLFTRDRVRAETVFQSVRFGGGCLNDCVLQLTNRNLPFGGVGESGMGSYHGKHSFETFSHEKPILQRSFFWDIAARYMPFSDRRARLIRRLMD